MIHIIIINRTTINSNLLDAHPVILQVSMLDTRVYFYTPSLAPSDPINININIKNKRNHK